MRTFSHFPKSSAIVIIILPLTLSASMWSAVELFRMYSSNWFAFDGSPISIAWTISRKMEPLRDQRHIFPLMFNNKINYRQGRVQVVFHFNPQSQSVVQWIQANSTGEWVPHAERFFSFHFCLPNHLRGCSGARHSSQTIDCYICLHISLVILLGALSQSVRLLAESKMWWQLLMKRYRANATKSLFRFRTQKIIGKSYIEMHFQFDFIAYKLRLRSMWLCTGCRRAPN